MGGSRLQKLQQRRQQRRKLLQLTFQRKMSCLQRQTHQTVTTASCWAASQIWMQMRLPAGLLQNSFWEAMTAQMELATWMTCLTVPAKRCAQIVMACTLTSQQPSIFSSLCHN